ncbi:MAG: hypothetical protein CfClM3_0257 [Methanobrevibacter sp. CfCl-M3]
MNYKAIFLISILIISSIGYSCANTITVTARSQDNDGDGIIKLTHLNNTESHINIKKGETITTNIDGVKDIRFHSVKRHNCYDAALHHVDDYNADKECNQSLEGMNIEVNFYKKSCYYNKFVWTIGYWYYTNSGGWMFYHDGGEFRYGFYILKKHGWMAYS